MLFSCVLVFVFFKQKTAYEMRISDWSSDVCSSDLADGHPRHALKSGAEYVYEFTVRNSAGTYLYHPRPHDQTGPQVYRAAQGRRSVSRAMSSEIGRASCRERVCQYV